MDDFEKSLRNRLQKSEFKKEWDSLQFEYQIQSELIKARTAAHMTQSELAAKSGVRQSNISRIENGNALPKLDTLAALASATRSHAHSSLKKGRPTPGRPLPHYYYLVSLLLVLIPLPDRNINSDRRSRRQ